MNSKHLGTIVAIIVSVFLNYEPAQAGGYLTLSGKWAGPAFASVIDMNGDGIGARTFDLRVQSQPLLSALQGVVDSGLVALPGQGSCADPGALELIPYGKLTFRGPLGAIYADVNPTPHLCFNPANPSETLYFTITGGVGAYAGQSGSGSATIRDVSRLQAASGAPLYVDSMGEFSLTVR